MTNFFTRDSHYKWAFVDGPKTSSNKSKMVDCGHIEVRKLLMYPYSMNILNFCTKFGTKMQHDHTKMPT